MLENIDDLDRFLKQSGIRHFSAREVVQLGRRKGSAVITMPLRFMWWRIIPTLAYLDRIRDEIGPIRVLSGYRPSAYNTAVGGADTSLHVAFNAVDWRPVDYESEDIEDLEALTERVTHGGHMHGIGVYTDRNPNDDYDAGFIHLDTRGFLGRPVPARWGGSSG